ncbi:glycoside hydrolase family 2 TIM barrel-domain containing protein [Streptomyces coelicoflavus]|uniref:glycoside hydrolase family 2 TIM barrel-domain containing protein n=1 Tax=Streptomyces coelicoflavus TaxID=285562 RepID=UPI001EF26B4A|nr:glycoside hydrolase family 2 TIM barrel-domain containing protein [Streptomyces coelicoflavus]
MDYTFQGGIYRNVSLHAVDKLAVRMLDYAGPGVYLRQRNVTASSATIDVTARIFNNHGSSRSVLVRAVVTDADGNVVADRSSTPRPVSANSGIDVVQTLTITTPRLWNGLTDPHLYKTSVEIRDAAARAVTDVVTEPLGLRAFGLDPDTGFSLNGKHLSLHGVNLHQDRMGDGWAISNADHEQDFALLREIGASAVRMAHYQHDQKSYDLADSAGLVLWAEIPLVNKVTASAAHTENTDRRRLLHILQGRNDHPLPDVLRLLHPLHRKVRRRTLVKGVPQNRLQDAEYVDLVPSTDTVRLQCIQKRSTTSGVTVLSFREPRRGKMCTLRELPTCWPVGYWVIFRCRDRHSCAYSATVFCPSSRRASATDGAVRFFSV